MALEGYLHLLCRNKVTIMQEHQGQPSELFREPTAIGACLDPWHLHVLQTSAFWTCNLFVSFSSLSISRLLGLSQDSGPASPLSRPPLASLASLIEPHRIVSPPPVEWFRTS